MNESCHALANARTYFLIQHAYLWRTDVSVWQACPELQARCSVPRGRFRHLAGPSYPAWALSLPQVSAFNPICAKQVAPTPVRARG